MSETAAIDRAAGVNVVGYIHEQSGLGEIARLLVDVLRHAAIPYALVPVGRQPLASRVRRTAPVYETNVVCVNPDALPSLVERVGQSFFRDRRTVGFWWWEVESFPPTLAAAEHLVDEIWVGSRHVAGAVRERVEKPVHVFPVPIVRPAVDPVNRSTLGVPQDSFVFLFTFNFLSVFERKNPLGLIEAFGRAFAPGEGPVLVLKSINSRFFPRERARLRAAVAARPDIVLLDGAVEESRYRALVVAADAYVSLHRAEGLGLTIAEAMALGKPAIATAYSGNLEFMTDENSYLVPFELTPIPPGMGPYPPGTPWAEPNLEAAAAYMRAVVEQPKEASAKAERAVRDLESADGITRAADFVRERLAASAPKQAVPEDALGRAIYELMWGPDLERSRPLLRRARMLLRPLLRPYWEHQRRVVTLVLEALRDAQRR
jgi:glycosyltransferase involved in cell wall biosynthesis